MTRMMEVRGSGQKSGFLGRVERLWAVPLALGVTGFTLSIDRHGRPS